MTSIFGSVLSALSPAPAPTRSSGFEVRYSTDYSGPVEEDEPEYSLVEVGSQVLNADPLLFPVDSELHDLYQRYLSNPGQALRHFKGAHFTKATVVIVEQFLRGADVLDTLKKCSASNNSKELFFVLLVASEFRLSALVALARTVFVDMITNSASPIDARRSIGRATDSAPEHYESWESIDRRDFPPEALPTRRFPLRDWMNFEITKFCPLKHDDGDRPHPVTTNCRLCWELRCDGCMGHKLEDVTEAQRIRLQESENFVKSSFLSSFGLGGVYICRKCSMEIFQERRPGMVVYTRAFEILALDIMTLKRCFSICSTWRYAVVRITTMLTDVYTRLPYLRDVNAIDPERREFSALEVRHLMASAEQFCGHPRWLVQYLKCINAEDPAHVKHVRALLAKIARRAAHKQLSCSQMFCEQSCAHDEIANLLYIDLFQENVKLPEIRAFAVRMIRNISSDMLVMWLPLLVTGLGSEIDIEVSALAKFLIRRACSTDIHVRVRLFFLLESMLTRANVSPQALLNLRCFRDMLLIKLRIIPDGDRIASELMHSFHALSVLSNGRINIAGTIRKRLVADGLVSHLRPVILPHAPDSYCIAISDAENHIKSPGGANGSVTFEYLSVPRHLWWSTVRASVLAGLAADSTAASLYARILALNIAGIEKRKAMFKKEDMSKDLFVMNFQKLCKYLIRRTTIPFKSQLYEIAPITSTSGIVEWVNDASEVSKIPGDLSAFLTGLMNDPSNAGRFPYVTFVDSLAVLWVMTYVLGIKDRHLDNYMLLKSGTVFGIDFSWMFNHAPKPTGSIPPLKELVKGVWQQIELVRRLDKDVVDIYLELRKNCNLFALLGMSVASVNRSTEFTPAEVADVLKDTLKPGYTDEEARAYITYVFSRAKDSVNYEHVMHVLAGAMLMRNE